MERGNDMGPLDDCPFCRIGAEEEGSRSILYEDEQVLAFEDIRPQAPLHVLIVPRRHIRNLLELEEGDASLMGRLVLVANGIARNKKVDLSGFRLVVNCNSHGGQTVDHLHLHLLAGRRMGWPPG
jgi:histidine triad (HIT) family protein